jgi:hypothetical protein
LAAGIADSGEDMARLWLTEQVPRRGTIASVT